MKEDNAQQEYLMNILHLAEERTSPPPLPREGIPKTIIPYPIQIICKIFMLPFILLDQFVQKAAKILIKTPIKKGGHCKRRGNCCYYILLPERKGLLFKLYFFWQTQINGFFVRKKSPEDTQGNKILVLGCKHLQQNGSCNNYLLRPAICRRWPIVELFGHPKILKGCGFTLELRKSYKKEPYTSFFKDFQVKNEE